MIVLEVQGKAIQPGTEGAACLPKSVPLFRKLHAMVFDNDFCPPAFTAVVFERMGGSY